MDARLVDVQAFDELFVVSDLHLGGSPGVQIFHQGARLTETIRALTKRNPGQKLALVIAGDFVDFLAAANPAYLDHEGTVKKLEAIKGDKAFAKVFEALAEFVHTTARRLVIILGNHDVELALPHGREWLYTTIAGTDPAARGRIDLALDGWGYSCTVGRRKVLVVHGNEVDDWNVVDHHALLETNRALSRGKVVPEWTPNGGTKLVIDLMNAVKARYPMIDLVKPETEAALPIVAALDPENAQLFKFMRAASFKVRDQIKGALGFLGERQTQGQAQGQVPSDPPTDKELFDRFLAPALAPSTRAATSKQSKDDELAQMLAQANEAIHAGIHPRAAGPSEGLLGPAERIQSFFAGSTGQELLRRALKKWLLTDTSYDFWAEDDTFKRLDEAVGSDVEFVIAGHTHLHRAITRKRAKGYYFNSGTWIRLIRLTEHVLDDAEQFARVWEAFSAGTMEALDIVRDLGPNENEPLVRDISTVVGIHALGGNVTGAWGQLYLADDEGQLEAVPGSRLPTPIK